MIQVKLKLKIMAGYPRTGKENVEKRTASNTKLSMPIVCFEYRIIFARKRKEDMQKLVFHAETKQEIRD